MKAVRFRALTLALMTCCALPGHALDSARGAAAYERALELKREQNSNGALIELKNSVQADPTYLPAWIELGELYLSFGHGQLAEGAFERAANLGAAPSLTTVPRARSYLLQGKLDALLDLEEDDRLPPHDAASLLVLQGNALLEVGELDVALTHFERAEKLDPSSAAPIWGTAMVKLRQGDGDDARYHAERAKTLAPEQAETWFVRADIERQTGQHAEALADFSRAIELQPMHMPARLGRAALLIDDGKFEAAAADLVAVRKAQPDDLQAMHLQSLLFAMQGRESDSERVLNEARSRLKELPARVIDGNLPSLMLSAVLALKDKQPASAAAHLERYLARAKQHLGASKLLAAAYLESDRVADARTLLESLMLTYPNDAAVLSLLGLAYARTGDNTVAAAMLERAITLGADTPAARQQLGYVQLAGGDINAAMASFSAAAARNPDGEAAFMFALAALRAGSLDDAQRTVDALLARKPQEPAYHNLRGTLALMRNDPQAARAAWRQAVGVEQRYSPALLNLAALARTEGRPEEAAQLYEQVLKAHPHDSGALGGLADLARDAGRYDESVRHLREIMAHRPGDLDSGLQLIQTLILAKQYAEARVDTETLRRKHPDDVRPRLLAIDIDVADGRREQLATALRNAFDLARPEPDAMRLVMQRQAQYGLLEDALTTANTILQLLPNDLRANQEVGELEIQLGHYGVASQRAAAMEQSFPDSPAGPGLRAKLALAKGEPKRAIEALTVALARTPNHLELALARAQARLAADDVEQGMAELTALARDNQSILPILADAQMGAGRWPAAAATLEQLRKHEPANLSALNNLAWAYLQAGDTRATATAQALLTAAPDDVACLDTAGWVLVSVGEVHDGVRALRNALARAPRDSTIRYHLAAGLAKLGDKRGALEVLETMNASTEFPEQAEARQLRETLRHDAL